MPRTKDKEMEQFEKDLLQSISEMKRGEFAAVHTPEQIEARKRGRPVGSVKAAPKVSTTIRFDPDVLEALKATGAGWQTRVNDTMRSVVMRHRTKVEAAGAVREETRKRGTSKITGSTTGHPPRIPARRRA
ncbi:BrnA antitoxin of type II toxin-antitoxin system [Variovorax sp. PDC80]|nr:BrnA antitoxin of type II toxin-antitoxin system [Variovorax sp. PDC80]